LYPGLAIVGTALIFNTSQYIAVLHREQNLRKSFDYLNAMVESMVEGIIMTDTQCKISVINPAAKEILGLTHHDTLSAMDLADIVDKKHKIKKRLEDSMALNKIFKLDEVLIGDRFFQIFTAPIKTAVKTAGSGLLGGVIIFHDITSEKEIEKMRQEYTSILVHELRSPLDAIKKMAAVMIKKDAFKERGGPYKEYVRLIHDDSAQMLELVNNLLDVAKIEAGKFDIRKEPSNIQQIVENRLSFFKVSAQNARVELFARYGKNIPKKIPFDPLRISQVLNNLISNALKFAGLKGKASVEVFCHKKGRDIRKEARRAGIQWFVDKNLNKISDSLVIAVSNTGPIIPREVLPQLFNKFKQFKTAARSNEKGTGLGLVIAKGIVEGHGGIMGVESKRGIGTTFYFTIPM
jgi:PAS domain S-box-containing protein